jgi:hypothetical protein
MMKVLLRVCPLVVMLLFLNSQSGLGLDIVLEVDGVGSVAITDNGAGDGNVGEGVIDFNETFGGQFQAEGRVRQASGIFGRSVFISATPPAAAAVFRNTDSVDRDFSLTVNRSPFPEGVGPPLGWGISYMGSADDPTPADVDIPAHSVALSINDPAVTLGTLVGTAITVADDIALGHSAVVNDEQATEMQVVFAFSAGPGDEILLPQDEPFEGNAIFARVFNQEYRCVDTMNNRARQLAKKAAKGAEACVKQVASAGGGPSAQCTTDLTNPKTDAAEQKLLDSYVSQCAPIPPPAWGVNSASCCKSGSNDGETCADDFDCDFGVSCEAGACISGAVERAIRDLALDIFGGTALIGASEVGKCQRDVVKRAGNIVAVRWKEFRTCKKRNLNNIADDPSLIDTCLGPPQVEGGKISSAEQKLAGKVDSGCIGRGVLPVGSAFPGGECSDEVDASFAACVSARAACRFCLSVNVADDIHPALDCDLFDDGAANDSCP